MLEFGSDVLGLCLLVVCIGIVGVFLKDFKRLDDDKPPKGKMIIYRVCYKNSVLEKGSIAMSKLPVQFGRAKGSGNDIVIAPKGVAAETLQAISHAWFFIQKDTAGRLTVYSADASVGEKKEVSAKPKLVVLNGGQVKAKHAVRLDSEVVLKAKDLQVILSVEEKND